MPVDTNTSTRPAFMKFQLFLAAVLSLTPPPSSAQVSLRDCITQECVVAALNRMRDDELRPIQGLSFGTAITEQPTSQFSAPVEMRPPSASWRIQEQRVSERKTVHRVYFNHITDEFFIGDRVFHRDDHEAALATFDQVNTRIPEGVGWQAIDLTQYTRYMRIVQGLDTPMDQAIYNNCVVARSRGVSEKVLSEVRASCRETAKNPSMIDRWRWGD